MTKETIEQEFRRLMADKALLRAQEARRKADREFVSSHRAEWLEQNGDHWAAVYQEKLVASACNRDELEQTLRQCFGAEFRVSSVYVLHITEKPTGVFVGPIQRA